MRIVMMGTGTFAEPTFQELLAHKENVVGLFTQPDREGVKVRGSTRQTGIGMKPMAESGGIPVFQPVSINTPEGAEMLRGVKPDLLVVAAYGQILKPDIIQIPTLGAINVHASLLPKYRGASPIAHAILNGETVSGVTIIRISAGLDAGEMLSQQELPILPEETTGELEARLAPMGARMALEVVQQLKQGPVTGKKQDPALVTKAPKFTKEQGLIDWTQHATRILNHLRAMQPWPTAYTYLLRPGKEPMRLIVTRGADRTASAEEIPFEQGALIPQPNQQTMVVRCGSDTVLSVTELQPAGKKKMSAVEFLRGYPVQAGFRLGAEAAE